MMGFSVVVVVKAIFQTKQTALTENICKLGQLLKRASISRVRSGYRRKNKE